MHLPPSLAVYRPWLRTGPCVLGAVRPSEPWMATSAQPQAPSEEKTLWVMNSYISKILNKRLYFADFPQKGEQRRHKHQQTQISRSADTIKNRGGEEEGEKKKDEKMKSEM